MKRVRKLIGKLIKYDISCGTKYNYRKYIYIAVFIILNLLVFGNAINFAKIENIDVSIGDLYVYFFRGSGIVNIKTGEFDIPIIFLGIQIIIAAAVGYYAVDDIYGYGKQVFIRTSKKIYWWISKSIRCIFTVVSIYALIYLLLFIYVAVMGIDMSFTFHNDFLYSSVKTSIYDISTRRLIFQIFVMPVVFSIMISLIQISISFITGPIISFLFVMIYLFTNVLIVSPYMLANNIMLARYDYLNTILPNRYLGIIMNFAIMVVGFILGAVVIERRDIMKK